MQSSEGRAAVRTGIELERARNWIKAIEFYEKASKNWPDSRDIKYGLRRSKINFSIARRYADRSFERKLLTKTKSEALDLFDAILLQVRTQYVEPLSSTSFVAHGTESLYLALANEKFRKRNLRGVDPQQIRKLRKILRDEYWNKPIAHRFAARETVSRICDIAQSIVGISPAVVAMEYVFGGCNALDDYSSVLTPNRLDDLYGNIDGEFVGLGIEMKARFGRGMLLVNVLPDSPAELGGLKPDEYIVAIDGTDCRKMTTDEAARLLRGRAGSTVRLRIESADSEATREGHFYRRAVQVKSIPVVKIVDRDAGIGYIRMTGFQKSTARELDAALDTLRKQGMRALIWDVRGNPGGLLDSAVETLDRFIDNGVLVSTRGRVRSSKSTYTARQLGTWNIPLVLLVDGNSASASEIVAGAVRDHRRGTIIGGQTYGKWSVQSIYPAASESGDVLAADASGGLYRIDRQGKLGALTRGFLELGGLAFSDTGNRGAAVTAEQRLSCFDAQLKVEWSIEMPEPVMCVGIDPYGRHLAVALANGQNVVYDVNRKLVCRFETIRPLRILRFLATEPAVIGAAEYGLIGRFDMEGREVWSENVHANIGGICVTGDGQLVYAAVFNHGIRMFDDFGDSQGSYLIEGTPHRLACSFDTSRLVVTTLEKHLYWLDDEGELVWATTLPQEIEQVACDPLGNGLLCGFASGRLVRFEWDDGSGEVSQSTEEDRPEAADAPSTADRGTLGKYILQKPIGSGGMGTVYLAMDPELNRVVALKILPKEKAVNPGLVQRFRQEAQSAAQLKHDNIVSVYDAGKADGYLYIALEFVDGTDVAQLIKQRGPLPIRRSVEIVKQVAHALDHAFRRGIVHRDIKPSNMLIKRDGTVKLADMGLARSVDESLDSGVTRVGTTVGTVDYMAPEQARDSKSADIRSDIYSLGCAWYHMLTGKAPFPKGSITNKLYAHIAKPRPDPRKLNERIPESIAATVRRMMARSPKERYQTPAELLEQLERVSSRPDPASEK
eukprot:g10456.t1